MKGHLTLSVIPTIAPFLLPLFIQSFAARFPKLKIEIKEQTTSEIIRQMLQKDILDKVSKVLPQKDIVGKKLSPV